jgi:hypothetical protein
MSQGKKRSGGFREEFSVTDKINLELYTDKRGNDL